MQGRYQKYFQPIVITGDFMLFNLCFWAAFLYFNEGRDVLYPQYILLQAASGMIYFLLAAGMNIYHFTRKGQKRTAIFNIWKVLLFLILILEAGFNILSLNLFFRSFLWLFYLLLIISLPLWRFVNLYFLRLYRKSGYNNQKVAIVGYSASGERLVKYFQEHPEFNYQFIGYFDDKIKSPQVKGGLNALQKIADTQGLDEVYCSATQLDNESIMGIMGVCDRANVKLKFLPELDRVPSHLKMDYYGRLPVLSRQPLPLDNYFLNMLKRGFDIFFSLVVITFVLSWLLPLLALLIKIDSPGPAFFRQERTGINNKSFWCLKLRTMQKDLNNTGKQTAKGDQRITRLGRLLRMVNLDEYPQFFNVLMGDMSIVGPRPHMTQHTAHYSQLIDRYMIRHFIKPGITGLSQIKGFRGETVNPILMKSRIKEDIFYIQNWSFLLDLKIIVLTVLNMLKGERNAY